MTKLENAIRYIPQLGDVLQIEDRLVFLKEGYACVDASFAGSEFSIYSATLGRNVPINIRTTRKPLFMLKNGDYKSRCEITFIQDGEENVICMGYLFHENI